ncbi:hypothetical protein O4H61_14685 [Roseovarius aestuarii]|nr:hypothetical protein [Roseovarius aestuarii]
MSQSICVAPRQPHRASAGVVLAVLFVIALAGGALTANPPVVDASPVSGPNGPMPEWHGNVRASNPSW